MNHGLDLAPTTPDRRAPFTGLEGPKAPIEALRARIRAAHRLPESGCLTSLMDEADQSLAEDAEATRLATHLVATLRAKGSRGPVEELMREFSLSSAEGVALMCLAEALLRIPDSASRDALIRDKIGHGDWRSHLGHATSLFTGAATWGLVLTGRVVRAEDEAGLPAALTRVLRRAGEPAIRMGIDLAMRMLGGQFVTGRSIGEALRNSRQREAKGFRYSYDMLGEAAVTAADATRYGQDYAEAIAAIGAASRGRGPLAGPGISVKLSALHPRYARAQRKRVMDELLPRLMELALAASRHDIGFNIDAEETERLDLSLDLLEALAMDERLAGWDGLGFVVQAYQKRALPVLDFVIDLARRSGHRLMVRLVKGAYWDSEIKRAQVDGLDGFPVFTRKLHTDVSYLACARRLLAAGEAVFPQFATHNARTLADIVALAGEDFESGDYEFQCLHGMGETLYEEVVGGTVIDRPCRIYAPVGTHETLLAYLVRRLLENGANSSFVNRIADPAVPVGDLVANPVERARRVVPPGSGHPGIALPRDIFGPSRRNSRGLDLADEGVLAALGAALRMGAATPRLCRPVPGDGGEGKGRAVPNPADTDDLVGHVVEADDATVDAALALAGPAAAGWAATPPSRRAEILNAAADRIETRRDAFLGLLVREAGKSLANAVGEIREAVDFLRYYAAQAMDFETSTHRPLGAVACISPWNFPLAIFTGQVAAALAAGNAVLAKPAEETPLVAGLAVEILIEAGIPDGVLALLPGDGRVGARLVADTRIGGVLFTGSTEVAKRIQAELAGRLGPDGRPIPFVAETGGQNVMVVDSSALPEQVVADVVMSAFDSAGQRCSALRVLCLQEDIADRTLTMLEGAMAELTVGNPDRLATDVGPVISEEARQSIEAHVARMRERGHAVHRVALPPACAAGHFVPPTLIAIDGLDDLAGEVFGPVLHVLRFERGGLDRLVGAINETGYGLTFGVHSRIDATVAHLVERVDAGNLYVNRTLIGAVVGLQPFGGEGLSGTGPKAGGPLYLRRLLAAAPAENGLPSTGLPSTAMPDMLTSLRDALRAAGRERDAARCEAYAGRSLVGLDIALPGPVGESNRYSLHPRGRVLCLPASEAGLFAQIAACLATGNAIRLAPPAGLRPALDTLPTELRRVIELADEPESVGCAAILVEGEADAILSATRRAAARPGAIIPVLGLSPGGLEGQAEEFPLEWLLRERSVSTNTAAAGGNATLLNLGDDNHGAAPPTPPSS
ncbi:trifunctional transcriptional regulator/proline dehydrogenase/L-glutamate gamma-semialdehyde dehydrogenase [Methylobacterium sp. 77]|uniref:trifunctional transcriptional regulator/proline dehydrogenase/L-glutamate gamma-semialdehyde dehydrogenase n=2 Tax=Pseudomonadota TaxID=1224 RepID=UPI00039D9116|nr:trifunctional transcriptional regulator/proline dehydrogenase/L-glutamate gamma-semialdehyde dehydrogenase [Methylobacterium sp. 77]